MVHKMPNNHVGRLVLVVHFTYIKRIVGFEWFLLIWERRNSTFTLCWTNCVLIFSNPLRRCWLERPLNLIVICYIITHDMSMLMFNEMLITLMLKQVVKYKELFWLFFFLQERASGTTWKTAREGESMI